MVVPVVMEGPPAVPEMGETGEILALGSSLTTTDIMEILEILETAQIR
jgi:hypothetical protein